MYVVYPDVFFIRNLVGNGIVLYFTYRILKIPICSSWKRMLLGIGMGTLGETLLLICYVPSFFTLVNLFLFFPMMVTISLGRGNRKCWRKGIFMGYLMLFLSGGIAIGMENLWKINRLTLLTIGVTILLADILVRELELVVEKNRFLYQVELVNGNSRYEGMAFYDSGNRLRDWLSKGAVHIASEEVLQKLEIGSPKGLVPYKALGKEGGILEIYEVESLRIHTREKWMEFHQVLLGKAEDSLLKDKRYQIILNGNIMEKGA